VEGGGKGGWGSPWGMRVTRPRVLGRGIASVKGEFVLVSPVKLCLGGGVAGTGLKLH